MDGWIHSRWTDGYTVVGRMDRMMDEGNKRWLCVYRHGSFVIKAIRYQSSSMRQPTIA